MKPPDKKPIAYENPPQLKVNFLSDYGQFLQIFATLNAIAPHSSISYATSSVVEPLEPEIQSERKYKRLCVWHHNLENKMSVLSELLMLHGKVLLRNISALSKFSMPSEFLP